MWSPAQARPDEGVEPVEPERVHGQLRDDGADQGS